MTQADDRLKALFALDEPPTRDPAFSAAVMAMVVRRRFQEDMALLAVASIVAGGVLSVIWPTLQPALTSLSQSLSPMLGVLTLALCTSVIVSGRAGSALGLES